MIVPKTVTSTKTTLKTTYNFDILVKKVNIVYKTGGAFSTPDPENFTASPGDVLTGVQYQLTEGAAGELNFTITNIPAGIQLVYIYIIPKKEACNTKMVFQNFTWSIASKFGPYLAAPNATAIIDCIAIPK